MEWHELPKYNGIQVSQLIYSMVNFLVLKSMEFCTMQALSEPVDIGKMAYLSERYMSSQRKEKPQIKNSKMFLYFQFHKWITCLLSMYISC